MRNTKEVAVEILKEIKEKFPKKFEELVFGALQIKAMQEEIDEGCTGDGVSTVSSILDWATEDNDTRLVLTFLGSGKWSNHYSLNHSHKAYKILRAGLFNLLARLGGYSFCQVGKEEVIYRGPLFIGQITG